MYYGGPYCSRCKYNRACYGGNYSYSSANGDISRCRIMNIMFQEYFDRENKKVDKEGDG